MEKYLYTIGETSELLGESISCVRFWSDSFPQFIKPHRNAKGNRLFTKDDVETLRYVQMLLKSEGLTIEGAAKRLKGDRKELINKSRVLDSLREIRRQLVEIKSEIV